MPDDSDNLQSDEALVSNDEFVLRRIHKNHCSSDVPSNFHFAAFRPTRDDEDGISVFRERIISAAEVASLGRKPEEYFVVRLSVAALAQLGLSVVPDVDAKAPAGHAFIPELGLTKYQRNKQSLKDVLLELARMAANSIVHVPRVPQ